MAQCLASAILRLTVDLQLRIVDQSSCCMGNITQKAVACPKAASEVHIIPVVHCASEVLFPGTLTDLMVPPAGVVKSVHISEMEIR